MTESLTNKYFSAQGIDLYAVQRKTNSQTYQRGLVYFYQNRVKLKELTPTKAWLTVFGSLSYTVTIEVIAQGFQSACTCPVGSEGTICKHQVAAYQYLNNHLRMYGSPTWFGALDQILQMKTQTKRGGRKVYLVFSLNRASSDWNIVPVIVSENELENLRQSFEDTSPEVLPNVLEGFSGEVKTISTPLRADLCINAGPELVSLANMIAAQQRVLERYGYYYSVAGQSALNTGDILNWLAMHNAWLYGGTVSQPLQDKLQIETGVFRLSLFVARDDNGVTLQTRLNGEHDVLQIQGGTGNAIIADNPIWMLTADNKVLRLQDDLATPQVSALIRTPELHIPKEEETLFLERYLLPLAENVPIQGEEFEWVHLEGAPLSKRLYISEVDKEIRVDLRFLYGDIEVPFDTALPARTVARRPDTWSLVEVVRDSASEEAIYRAISGAEYGLKYGKDSTYLLRARVHPIDFLMKYVPKLAQDGFEIFGEDKISVRVNRNKPSLSLNITSGIDWFDVQAVVNFGEIEVALRDIRRALRRKEQYIKLADGSIGELPQDWLDRYKHLFALGDETSEGDLRLSNHHLTLIDQLLGESDRVRADEEFNRRRERLRSFEGITPQELPQNFNGELRPYQKSGYDWLHFLHEYNFGGCLADDMGLGKTIQVLCFLQSLRERGASKSADIIVLPRSLLVNWHRESQRFTPNLKILEYFGNQREKDVSYFNGYDAIITTYGVMMRDIEQLREYTFHYAILDESQAIKNPLAQTAKAARLLRAEHRLVMTGTPVENSTAELWSQFAFINPGLLGSLDYFKTEFASPIEKKKDTNTADFLRKMVYPFILRRTKDQVAPELPPRTERILYCDMEPAQRKLYNRTRDYYRGIVLGMLKEEGINSARMKILEGLLRLRQISNHPALAEKSFRGDSAKFEMLFETIETLRAEGHKALIFSQFVEMLKLIETEMKTRRIPYTYLDGRTRDRQARVDEFQNNPKIPFFLISLKAGGVGLNLTAADYVIHVDPWWNPAVEMQATDRAHRIGQDKPVFVFKLIARDSVEEKILQLQDQKRALVEQLISVEEGFVKSLTTEDIQVLFS
ncbi:MAG: DEAD/DEAH box helicase [Anaerolineales bacterium]